MGLIYRTILAPAFALFAICATLFRMVLRQLPTSALAERLGRVPAQSGPVVWIHGASLGELGPARGLAEQILDRLADHALLLTANSKAGRALLVSWNLPRTTVAFAPLDLGFVLRRLLTNRHVRLHLSIENELWPTRLSALSKLGCRSIAVSARMSDKTARRWAFLPNFAKATLGNFAHIAPQSTQSRANFQSLGVSDHVVLPNFNLKASQIADTKSPDDFDQLTALLSRDRTILAASTHVGEAEIVLTAFADLHRVDPALKLVIAPRDIKRTQEIITKSASLGLGLAQRSRQQAPELPVYLADTFYEMPIWCALSAITFVGGSLVDRGGHTPWEPAAARSAILHGPIVHNFAETYAELDAKGAALAVTEATLAPTLARLLADQTAVKSLADAAHAIFLHNQRDDSLFLDAILPK